MKTIEEIRKRISEIENDKRRVKMLISKILSLPLSVVVLFSGKCKGIIRRMLDVAKRWGPYLLIASAAFTGAGLILFTNRLILASILVWCVAFLCFACALYSLYCDIKDIRRKDHPDKTIHFK